MTPNAPNGEQRIDLRQYLLGNVSEEIQQQVEILVLTEKGVLEEVLLLEEELIDDYASGDLADRERTKFEQHFLLTPERHQKLRAATSLRQFATRKPKLKPLPLLERIREFWNIHKMQLATASSAALVLVVVGLIVIPEILRPPTFAELHLTISRGDRAGGGEAVEVVRLPLNRDALKIHLKLPDGLSPTGKYRVELDSGSREVTSLTPVVKDQSIIVSIPVEQLSKGQYVLKVYELQDDGTKQPIAGSYFFDIV